MSTTFWTLMLVSLNTPHAAVEIRPLPNSPAFQTKASCEDFAKLKALQGTVCFTGGAALTISPGGEDRPAGHANVSVMGGPWGSSER
jgi:hypothetical protein